MAREFGSTGWPTLPAHATYAVDLVRAPEQLRPALRRLLERVAVVDGLAEARALVEAQPGLVAATRDGDLLGRAFAHGGSASSPSLLEVQAAVDEASEQLVATTHRCERLRFSLTQARRGAGDGPRRVEAALARLHESDARLSAVAEQLGQLGSAARSATAEADRQNAAIASAQQRQDAAVAALDELTARLSNAEAAPDIEEPDTHARDALATEVVAARDAETEARLAVRTGEERARALHGRADQLERDAEAERQRARAGTAAAGARRAGGEVGRAVLRACDIVLSRLDGSLALAADRPGCWPSTSARCAKASCWTCAPEDASSPESSSSSPTRCTATRWPAPSSGFASSRSRRGRWRSSASTPRSLLAEYGPDQLVPPSPLAPDEVEPPEPRQPVPYVRAEQEKRLRGAERNLAQLGRVNPLALEEFSAMEERHQFLTEQLEDLKKTKRDLLEIVREVDERVEQVFTEAYHDVAREFVDVFARLFPGGEGKLVLTDPSTCSAPASTSRRVLRARRSSGCRSCPAVSVR